jgi:hypothetical protein
MRAFLKEVSPKAKSRELPVLVSFFSIQLLKKINYGSNSTLE